MNSPENAREAPTKEDLCTAGTAEEGGIKYASSHTFQDNVRTEIPAAFAELDAARTILHDRKLIGSTPPRGAGYGGIGYGNISLRVEGDCFLISGSGTGALRVLGSEGYSLVRSFNVEKNQVASFGPVRASSEAMTHGAIYEANPVLGCVIHVHSRELFDRLLRQGWAHTPVAAAYGTPDLSRAVADLVRSLPRTGGVFVTAGHAEGLFACGVHVSDTLDRLLRLHTKH